MAGQRSDYDDRFLTFEGWVGSNQVIVKRDCECTSVVVKRNLTSDKQITVETVTRVSIDGTCVNFPNFPTAVIDIQ